jgi:hypothetical protein
VASTRLADWPAKRLVKVYRQRMQIELSFRANRGHANRGQTTIFLCYPLGKPWSVPVYPRSKKSRQAVRNARELWLLVASTRLADWPAKRLVKVYRQRMQIELSFRDMKSQHFGEGLECSASSGAGRYTVRVLIASLAAILLWLIGTAAERCGVHERMRPGSRKRRAYSLPFLARRLLTLEDCRTTIAELVDVIEPPDQWVANDHDRLLAK